MAGTSAWISVPRRTFTNTDALEGLVTVASGSLFGSTMWTRATITPSILLSVSDKACSMP